MLAETTLRINARGWVTLEITGLREELEKGIEYLESLGVKVKPISGDVVGKQSVTYDDTLHASLNT